MFVILNLYRSCGICIFVLIHLKTTKTANLFDLFSFDEQNLLNFFHVFVILNNS